MRIQTVILLSTFACTLSAEAQTAVATLSLDSCKARALRANKQVSMARVKQEVARNTRKAARTKYMPHVDVQGGYMYSSREISILSDQQQAKISSLGTTMGTVLGSTLPAALTQMLGAETLQGLVAAGNQVGQEIVDAFHTNTHHIFTASATFTQPVFMGGAIVAGNKMADIAEQMAAQNIQMQERDILYNVENAYWTVVSLKQKQQLAADYLTLVQKLDGDVQKMITQGVATRADGLKVSVAVNEAEMTKTKVDNGLALSRMYLNQLCGMPLDSQVTLDDENSEKLETSMPSTEQYGGSAEGAYDRRPELQLLNSAVGLTQQQTKIAKAAYLPQVALMGGVLFSNPSVYNSFERKFKGAFNVGVMVRIPVLDWGDAMYKIRASKCSTTLAQLTYSEAKEKVELQISQSQFKVSEAEKNLAAATKNIERAEENLRCANLGFKEGVMQTTDVMAAQTAWMQAHSNKVDAQINVKMSQTALRKALGY